MFSPKTNQILMLDLTVIAGLTPLVNLLTTAGLPAWGSGVAMVVAVAGTFRLAYTQAIQSLSPAPGDIRPPAPVHPMSKPGLKS